ncbi:hypothetical protein NSTC731_03235 [Nostoc sp. DSM 114167]|jgi:hypothetical protein
MTVAIPKIQNLRLKLHKLVHYTALTHLKLAHLPVNLTNAADIQNVAHFLNLDEY